jgi:hypothetical protein
VYNSFTIIVPKGVEDALAALDHPSHKLLGQLRLFDLADEPRPNPQGTQLCATAQSTQKSVQCALDKTWSMPGLRGQDIDRTWRSKYLIK